MRAGDRRGRNGGGGDRVRKREVERCWKSMTAIPDHLSTFIPFIQLKSLRKRTEEDVRWVTRVARQCGVTGASAGRGVGVPPRPPAKPRVQGQHDQSGGWCFPILPKGLVRGEVAGRLLGRVAQKSQSPGASRFGEAREKLHRRLVQPRLALRSWQGRSSPKASNPSHDSKGT